MGVLLAIVLLGALGGGYYTMRRMRDPRLDRDWSDDEATPYDAPAGPQLFEGTAKFGSSNMSAYERMLGEEKPRDY